jgi:hypothetical protein
MTFAVISRELLGGATCEHLVEATGLHIETVRALIRETRDRGVTIIGSWMRDTRGAYTVRVHRFKLTKFEVDAPRPVSDATLSRRRYGRQP